MSLGLDQDKELDAAGETGVAPVVEGDQAATGRAAGGELPQGGGGEAGAGDRPIIAVEDRAPVRRWAIIAAVVLLVHGAVATAVLTWRRTAVVPAERPRSIVIELVPAPGEPATRKTELPPAAEQKPTDAAPEQPTAKVERNAQQETAPNAEEKVQSEAVEDLPRARVPAMPAPSERVEEERGVESGAAISGGAPAAAPAPSIGANPIDTRMAEPPHLRFKRASRANDWKNAIMGRPLSAIRPFKSFAGQPRGPGAGGSVERNAVGVLVQNGTFAAGAGATNGMDGTKNAAGGTIAGAASNTVNGTTTNAIGVAVLIRAGATGANVGQRFGQVTSVGTTPLNATINGTSMTRPGAGAGAIGGPARAAAGVINGTTIRPRYR